MLKTSGTLMIATGVILAVAALCIGLTDLAVRPDPTLPDLPTKLQDHSNRHLLQQPTQQLPGRLILQIPPHERVRFMKIIRDDIVNHGGALLEHPKSYLLSKRGQIIYTHAVVPREYLKRIQPLIDPGHDLRHFEKAPAAPYREWSTDTYPRHQPMDTSKTVQVVIYAAQQKMHLNWTYPAIFHMAIAAVLLPLLGISLMALHEDRMAQRTA